MTSQSAANLNSLFSEPVGYFNLRLLKTRERHIGLKWDFVRIEGASGTPKKGFKIGKVKFHGVSPLSTTKPYLTNVVGWLS